MDSLLLIDSTKMVLLAIARWDWHDAFAPSNWSNWTLVVVGVMATWVALSTLKDISEQTRAAKIAAEAAKESADALINSERAWILASLGWYDKGQLRITLSDSVVAGRTERTTVLTIKLTCKNDGRSPAWIEDVLGRADIFSGGVASLPQNPPDRNTLQICGRIGSLGSGEEQSRALQITCTGHPQGEDFISVYVVVIYRDIFQRERHTSLGYSIDPRATAMYRQDALTERNKST
jgi:hypothetical protein